MEIQHSTTDGCLVVALTGSIDLFSVSQVRRALLKDLSGQPYALICDLSGVQGLDPVCATVFATVANHPSSRWPTTSFLLCGAQPPVAEILNRLQVPHFLRLYPGIEEALEEVFARPPYLRDELVLPQPRRHRPRPAPSSGRSASTGGSPSPTPPRPTGQSCWPTSWSPTPWSTPAPRSGCGWSCAATCCISRCAMAARGCCAWSPSRARRRRGDAGSGGSSSSPVPGA